MTRWLLLPLLVLLTGCSTGSFTPRTTTLAADRVELPMAPTKEGILYVEARINGAGPFRLMVDTGAGSLFLKESAARAAGLRIHPTARSEIKGVHDQVEAGFARVRTLESGGLTLSNFWAFCLDDVHLENSALAQGFEFDGALGMSLLQDVVLELDFPERKVSVLRAGSETFPAEARVSFAGIPPEVSLELGGRSVPVKLDTGATGGIALPDLNQFPLVYPPVKDSGGSVGIGATFIRGESSQLEGTARLGPVTWINPPIDKGEGRIGLEVLEDWKVVVDQKNQALYFISDLPVTTWQRRALPDPRYIPGFFFSFESRGLRVVEVDPGMAAERAGLRVGDVILSVDGESAQEYLRSGQKLPRRRMRVEREGIELVVTMILSPEAE